MAPGAHYEQHMREAELRAELARIEAEKEAEAQRRAAVLKHAQHHYDRRMLDTWKAYDDEVSEAGTQAMQDAVDAVHRGDLDAAFDRYTAWLASRQLRNHIRSAAHNAATRLGIPEHDRRVTELHAVDYDFAGFLNQHGHDVVSRRAADAYADEYESDYPLTYDEIPESLKNWTPPAEDED